MERVLRAEAEREGRAEAAREVGEGAAEDGAGDAAEADVEERVGVDLAGVDRGLELGSEGRSAYAWSRLGECTTGEHDSVAWER